ncbi:MAG: hypothetical protein EAZ57_10035 [Cytophagales bacterium]|nr:MAG: hypothetical protein EAZ67_10435 [Cytophagales bacterium]TAF59780.1 MAG: hypothetical protein EAZ57_10035 [Cytophagales bacterium]
MNALRIFLLLSICLASQTWLFAQTPHKQVQDSLHIIFNQLSIRKDSTVQILSYLESDNLKEQSIEFQYMISELIVQLNDSLNLQGSNIKHWTRINQARLLRQENNYASAIRILNDVKRERKELKILPDDADAILYSEISRVYIALGNYEQALDHLFYIFKNDASIKNSRFLADAFLDAAEAYLLQDNIPVGKVYLERAIELALTGKHWSVWTNAQIKKANIEIQNQKLEKAQRLLNEIKKNVDLNKSIYSGEFYLVSALLQEARKDWMGAEARLTRAKQLAVKTKNIKLNIKVSQEFGRLALKKSEYNKAANYYGTAIELIKQNKRIEKSMLPIYQNMAIAKENQKDYTKAFFYQKLYSQYADSIYQKEIKDRIDIRQLEINNKTKDNQIEELEKENARNKRTIELEQKNERYLGIMLALFFVALLIAVAFILDRYRRAKALKYKNTELEKRNQELKLIKNKLEQSEKRLDEMNRTKDKFFSIIAHDIRSPLNSQKGFADLIAKFGHKLSIEDIKKMAQNQQKAINGLFALLENLLTWARAQLGAIAINPETLDLEIVFEDLRNLFAKLAQDKGIVLEIDTNTHLTVWADRNALQTALRNLMSNSLKFTNRNGTIRVAAQLLPSKSNQVEIIVQDTGVGMSKEAQNQLFKLDTKYSTKGTDGETGTGLGLVIVQEFIEHCRGTITVESEENKGSTFTIRLPAMASSIEM